MKYNGVKKRHIALLVVLVAGAAVRVQSALPVSTDDALAAIDKKVEAVVKQMTLDEKMNLMHGDKERMGYDGPPAIPRLNIPAYVIAHGPYGARAFFPNEQTGKRVIKSGTFMGVSMNYAASWDPDLIGRVAHGMGKEIRCADNHAVAGPAFNIVRDLRCGRATEYFTEDPYLCARTSVPFVKALQDEKVVVTLKHYACNNQEWSRGFLDVRVSKRALHEIYLPGFEYAVTEADAWSVMSAYNKVNGKWCAENPYLLDDVLRKRWGFKGFVLSDWSGTHSTVDSVVAGLDLEMPRARWYGKELKAAVESGAVSMALIDERVSNILRTLYVAECMESEYKNPPAAVFKSAEMKALAHELALNSMVLLKNEGSLLPLDKTKLKKIAVLGPHANYGSHFIPNEGEQYTLFQTGGSANVKPEMQDMITPLEGIREYLGDAVEVVYAPGVYAEGGCGPIDSKYLVSRDRKPGLSAVYYKDTQFGNEQRRATDQTVSFQWDKDPSVPEAGKADGSKARYSVRWEGQLKAPQSRKYTLELRFEGQAKLIIDGREVFSGKGNNDLWWQQVKVDLKEGLHDVTLEYVKNNAKGIMKLWWDYENVEWTKKAVQLAEISDAVILNVGNTGNMEREGRDRFQGLELSPAQQELIKAVTAANKNTAVITFTAGVTMESWIDNVPAIIQAMYPGEQAGNALARLIFGKANPSGKLTVSIPKSTSQYPADYWGPFDSIEYKEDVFVGYRFFDEKNIEPQFPFGHGLSFTTFFYGEPKVTVNGQNATVTLDITNAGSRAGAEVVQLYVHDVKCSVPRPPKELKAFKKIMLQPGETKAVTLELDSRSFAFFDEKSDNWKVEPGEFELLIGSSSRDIRRPVACIVE